MKVYFVRHGESTANLAKVVQGPDSVLTELGKQQAEFVAKRFTDIPIDFVVSSPYPRAVETAGIITSHLNKEFVTSDLIIERIKPAVTIGLADGNPIIQTVYDEINAHKYEKDWHHSDEENAHDLLLRAGKFVDYLESLRHNHILVVTHGIFLRYIVLAMLDRDLDLAIIDKFMPYFQTINTGITLCDYDPKRTSPANKWRLITWNDHAHL